MRLATVVGLLLVVSCGGSSSGGREKGRGVDGGTGGSSSGCAPGSEGCRCYGNDTCDSDLSCASNLCVELGAGGAGGGAAGDGGAFGAGGKVSSGMGGATPSKGGAPASSGSATGSGGLTSDGGSSGSGGATQCSPVNTLCSLSEACCLGLVCVTETGRSNGVCTSACVSDSDCSTGCCAPLDSSFEYVCAPSVYCAGQCLPEYASCTAFPSDCCEGTACLYDDDSQTTASCQYICTQDAECLLGCCSPIQGLSYNACANPSYCGGSCLPAGTRPCGLGTECCPGSYCTADAINQICLPRCFTDAECESGCCASQNGNGVTVCSNPAFCGTSGSGGATGSGGTAGSGGATGSGGSSGAPLSCVGLADTCGPTSDEDCCASPVVTGGTFDRSNNPSYPATVSTFRLDRFEVTVGRFRKFLASYDAWRAAGNPATGAGAHPLLGGSGWDPAWSPGLPGDAAAFAGALSCDPTFASWTDAVGANENKPIGCVSSLEAFAFCAWDGGRLATEAEWNYAAAGGAEQRAYPWGGAAPIPSLAAFDCTGDGFSGCALADLRNVGTRPDGDGRYGQADLAGSLAEWNLDRQNCCSPPWPGYASTACIDCSTFAADGERAFRGGSFEGPATWLTNTFRMWGGPRVYDIGMRCAREE